MLAMGEPRSSGRARHFNPSGRGDTSPSVVAEYDTVRRRCELAGDAVGHGYDDALPALTKDWVIGSSMGEPGKWCGLKGSGSFSSCSPGEGIGRGLAGRCRSSEDSRDDEASVRAVGTLADAVLIGGSGSGGLPSSDPCRAGAPTHVPRTSQPFRPPTAISIAVVRQGLKRHARPKRFGDARRAGSTASGSAHAAERSRTVRAGAAGRT